MKRNTISKGVLAFMLVLALIFIGCDEDEPDVWSPVTSLSQLNGRWVGSYSQTMSVAELSYPGLESLNANVTMTYSGDITFNASAQTFSGTESQTMSFGGNDGQIAYNTFKLLVQSAPNVTANDSNRSIIISVTTSNHAIPVDYFEDLEINQNGSKIRRQIGEEEYMVLEKR